MRKAIAGILAALLLYSCAGAEEQKYTLPLDLTAGMPLRKENYLSDMQYQDPTIEMTAREVNTEEAHYWIAEVTIQDGSQIRTMPARTFTTAASADSLRISQRANAVLGCDGDFWSADVGWKGNYVLRQGKLYMYRLTGRSDLLLIDEEGDFHIIRHAAEEDVPLPDESDRVMYEGKQIYNALCFGPVLVMEGKALEVEPDEHIRTSWHLQRMALCQMGEKHYAIICCYTERLDLQGFANLLETLGVETAYNLDGGNSAMMFTGSRMINRNYKRREIADIVYFASAWPGEE